MLCFLEYYFLSVLDIDSMTLGLRNATSLHVIDFLALKVGFGLIDTGNAGEFKCKSFDSRTTAEVCLETFDFSTRIAVETYFAVLFL